MKRFALIFVLLVLMLGMMPAFAQDGFAPNPTAVPTQAPRVDSDGDGLPDSNDLCPTVAGPRELRGCPSTIVTPQPPPAQPDPNVPPPAQQDPSEPPPAEIPPAGVPPVAETPVPPPAFVPPTLPADRCAITPEGPNRVNVRSAPDINAEIIGALFPGVVYAAQGFVMSGSDAWLVLTAYEGGDGVTVGYAARFVLIISSLCAEIPGTAVGGSTEPVVAALELPQDCEERAIDHAVTVLAWARVDGVSPIQDDVIVDGRIITAEDNFLSDCEPSVQNVVFGAEGAIPDPFVLTFNGSTTRADSSGRPMESLSINFTKIEFKNDEAGLHMAFTDAEVDGPQRHDDGTTTVEYCIYVELYEVGVFNQVCYEIEIPPHCTLTTSEAGVYTVVCDETGVIELNPALPGLPSLDLTLPSRFEPLMPIFIEYDGVDG